MEQPADSSDSADSDRNPAAGNRAASDAAANDRGASDGADYQLVADPAWSVSVTVVRSGGFAGLKRTWEATADDQPTADAWLGFADALPWGRVASHDPRSADRYVYRILIIVHSEVRHEATLPESELTGGWRELVERVQREAELPAAGTADTGTAHSGTADTGATESGTADTGTADTGTADTGTADNGTADTGTADTGTADTGTAESGTADTGTAESGTATAGTAGTGTAGTGTATAGGAAAGKSVADAPSASE